MKSRQQIIKELFETQDIAKRSMHIHMRAVVEGHSISRSQLELLFTIKQDQPTTAKQLAEKLHLTPGAISQFIEELSEQSLVTREVDPGDRRRQLLRLSPEGDKLIRAFDRRRRAIMERVIENLSDEELVIWLKIHQKLISEFKQIHQQHSTTNDPERTDQ